MLSREGRRRTTSMRPSTLADVETGDVALGVAPPGHRQLRSPAGGVEPPEVGEADQLLPVDDALLGEVGPLVRTARVTGSEHAGRAAPQDPMVVADVDSDHAARAHVVARQHVGPRHGPHGRGRSRSHVPSAPVDDFDDLTTANAAYAGDFTLSDLAAAPARNLAVVTCMDCRIDPLAVLGLEPGDAHVLRNAGARVTDDVLRSLVKSVNQLGVTRIVVMHHTDCGAAKIVLADLRQKVAATTGNDPAEVDFHLIGDPDAALADDVAALCAVPLPAGGHTGGGPALRRHDRRGRTPPHRRGRLTRPTPIRPISREAVARTTVARGSLGRRRVGLRRRGSG